MGGWPLQCFALLVGERRHWFRCVRRFVMPGRVCAGATLALAMFREAARISIPLPGWGAEGQGNRKVKVH